VVVVVVVVVGTMRMADCLNQWNLKRNYSIVIIMVSVTPGSLSALVVLL
jgi:hypothetical protein